MKRSQILRAEQAIDSDDNRQEQRTAAAGPPHAPRAAAGLGEEIVLLAKSAVAYLSPT